jgi:hypothetical protein
MREDSSTVAGSGRRAWRSPLVLLDSIRKAIGSRIGTHQVRVGPPATNSDYPGWNISDEIALPADGECRYVIELACGQMAFAEVASAHPVVISVWDDEEYDRSQAEEYGCDTSSAVRRVVCEGSTGPLEFPTARTGPYDIVVSNAGDQLAQVAIRITAAPARAAATGSGREDHSDTSEY